MLTVHPMNELEQGSDDFSSQSLHSVRRKKSKCEFKLLRKKKKENGVAVLGSQIFSRPYWTIKMMSSLLLVLLLLFGFSCR